jgi:hypothetical protein
LRTPLGLIEAIGGAFLCFYAGGAMQSCDGYGCPGVRTPRLTEKLARNKTAVPVGLAGRVVHARMGEENKE